MKVILKEDIPRLGEFGDIVNVKPGFARNFLFPMNKAIQMCERDVKVFEHRKKLIIAQKEKDLKNAKTLAQKIESTSCTIQRKVSEEDKIYGSVTTGDIEKALKTEGIPVDKKYIELETPIKTLGVYSININITKEISAKLKLWVVEE